MLKKIKVTPIAEESFGVRSMCTYLETPDTNILLDAGVSLAPYRVGYSPHPKEYRALIRCRKNIRKMAQTADIITISHYHFDHYTPFYIDWFTYWSSPQIAKEIYTNKVVIAKSFRSKVNISQRRRGWMFKKTAGDHLKRLETADGKSFKLGETILRFSEPVFHGSHNSALGWVVMVTIKFSDETILYASDVQGPICASTLRKILAENPQLVIVGGPPTYLAGFRVENEHIKVAMENLTKLVESVPTTILGHHTLRDEKWKNKLQRVFDAANKSGNKVLTAAEYAGQENNFLEFRRRQLFEEEPPNSDFKKWLRLPLPKRKLKKPPI